MATTITPKQLNFRLGTQANFAEATTAHGSFTVYPYAAAVLSPAQLKTAGGGGSYDGTFTRYENGLLAVMYSYYDNTLGFFHYPIELFDLATLERIDVLDVEEFSHADTDPVIDIHAAGIAPIQNTHEGYIYWATHPSSSGVAKLVRWGWFDDGAGNAIWTAKSSSFKTEVGSPLVDHISDVAPIPYSRGVDFIVARAGIDVVSEKHLYSLITNLNQSYTSAPSADTFTVLWSKAYTPLADWTDWAGEPDSVLAVEVIGQCGRTSQGNIVALMGDWVTNAIHKRVEHPVLAVIAGTGQTAYKKVTVSGDDAVPEVGPGGVIESHEEGAYHAHGMCVDQLGYIYVVGTGGLMGTNEHLIEKYKSWDLAAGPVAFVDHDDADNGSLGGEYANAADTHVYAPTFTGDYLVVFDHSANKTEAVVFTPDLVYVTKFDVSTTGTDVKRWFGDKHASPWYSRSH